MKKIWPYKYFVEMDFQKKERCPSSSKLEKAY